MLRTPGLPIKVNVNKPKEENYLKIACKVMHDPSPQSSRACEL